MTNAVFNDFHRQVRMLKPDQHSVLLANAQSLDDAFTQDVRRRRDFCCLFAHLSRLAEYQRFVCL